MNRKPFFKILITAVGATAALLLLPLFLRLFAPFIPAFIIASAAQPLVRFLERRIKISRGISSAALVTLIVSAATALICAAVFRILAQTKNLAETLPELAEDANLMLTQVQGKISTYTHRMPSDTVKVFEVMKSELLNRAKSISVPIGESVFVTAKKLAYAMPDFLFFITMFIISTFFFIKDYRLVTDFMKEIIPKGLAVHLRKVKAVISKAFSSYIKAQLILMLMTSATVTLCLWISGMKSPLLFGALCGAVDALPFFGTAIILLPWALAELIGGDVYSFAALLITQAAAFIVRQLSEPKIVSRQIGIHPLLTLIAVYIGLRFFGILGMICAPIFMLLAVNIYASVKEPQNRSKS